MEQNGVYIYYIPSCRSQTENPPFPLLTLNRKRERADVRPNPIANPIATDINLNATLNPSINEVVEPSAVSVAKTSSPPVPSLELELE